MKKNKRSIMSKIVETAIRCVNTNHFIYEDSAKKHLKKRSLIQDEPLDINLKKYKGNVNLEYIDGIQVLTFGNKSTATNTVLYIHGGAYVDEIHPLHIRFLNRIAKLANSYIIAPIYKLAPNHTYKETYKTITSIYKRLLNQNPNKLTLMGDSAGGGFILGFCQYIKNINIQTPDLLICISPWVDISMSNPELIKYEKKDPMLGIAGTKVLGATWADELDSKDYKVSPLYGNSINLPKTLIFTGTHEVIYPDIYKFYKKIVGQNVESELCVGYKMNHIYPLYLHIPESKKAINKIVDTITK
ncbi:alpha/beta hydrolase fold domain-containing protein [Holzapfeliella sp. JNUCC 80]